MASRDKKKVEARLNLDHLTKLARVTGVPLVLHGGSGIREEDVRQSFVHGIAKINVGTEIRQVFETVRRESNKETDAQQALYERTRSLIRETYRLTGSKKKLSS
jgi:fructose/tagatose bisphosphate aldolase